MMVGLVLQTVFGNFDNRLSRAGINPDAAKFLTLLVYSFTSVMVTCTRQKSL